MLEIPPLVAYGVKIALLALLAGILWRGRARQCWSFALYVIAVLAANLLVSAWPARFWNADFWMLRQWTFDTLKMAVVAELAWRALSRFPRAARTGRAVVVALLVLGTLAIAPAGQVYPGAAIWQARPQGAAVLWLLAAALIVIWFQLPSAQRWQRAIVLGLAPLLIFAGLYGLLLRQGRTVMEALAVVDLLGYFGLLVFWTWAAWRREAARGGLVRA